MTRWKLAAKEFWLRYKLHRERADKWMKLAMVLQDAQGWARRWKQEAKFLSTLQKRQRREIEFLIAELAERERRGGSTEH